MNLYHDISLGDNAPQEFNCVVEIPKGSHNKYEIDKATGLIALDRANYNAAPYPFDYAFAPQTLWDDGDALDVVILSTWPLAVGVMVTVRPVAIINMVDAGESDAKIIAVPVGDRRFEHIHDLADLNKHNIKEFTHFFETYKLLKSDDPHKYPVVINGVDGKEKAIEAIKKSITLYQQKFGK
ncbi:MAG TPA: inorganic diphosphatase [Candidatus Paceibacterota bacterium]|nr:inorganic diphosphatase [Candidatus Paceibacterota bacterium]